MSCILGYAQCLWHKCVKCLSGFCVWPPLDWEPLMSLNPVAWTSEHQCFCLSKPVPLHANRTQRKWVLTKKQLRQLSSLLYIYFCWLSFFFNFIRFPPRLEPGDAAPLFFQELRTLWCSMASSQANFKAIGCAWNMATFNGAIDTKAEATSFLSCCKS